MTDWVSPIAGDARSAHRDSQAQYVAAAGGDLFIGATRWCKGGGTGSKDRMVVYNNDRRFVKMDELVPLARIMSQPNVANVCYDTAYMANISEVQLFYPTSIRYVDGI